MIGFVHIPKTGGVDFKNRFTGTGVIIRKYHKDTANTYKLMDVPCFAIIRDPVQRFVSSFIFNLTGSKHFNHKLKEFNDMKHIQKIDINDYVNLLRRDPAALKEHTEMMIHKSQLLWLDGDPENTYILKYTNDNNSKIHSFLKNQFNINYVYYTRDDNINITIRDPRIHTNLTDANLEFIQFVYKKDIEFYEKLVALEVEYCKMSEIIN